MRVLAFLDMTHPAVAWAVMRGVFVSADLAHPDPVQSQSAVSYMLAGMIQYQNNARLFNETVIEQVRSQEFRPQVSRLRGMYFFHTRREALEILNQGLGDHFVEENLLELDLHFQQPPSCVDANWITFARRDSAGRISLEDLDWIRAYWAGLPYRSTPVWELIVNGFAIVLDTEVRRRCYDFLRQKFPESHVPIEMAHLAGEVGSSGGQMTPFLIRRSAAAVELCYLSNEGDFHDKEVIARIAQHPSASYLGKLMAAAPEWRAPDFRPWFRTFTLTADTPVGGLGPIPKVHLSH